MSDIDLFQLLAVSRREDSYSSVITHALSASPGLRQTILRRLFPEAPELRDVRVGLRRGLPGHGIVDVLIDATDSEDRTWVGFIENKIDAVESDEQTLKYLRGARIRAGDAARAAGIFLTLDGRDASAAPVKPMSHRELAGILLEHRAELPDGSGLRLAVEHYVEAARREFPQARDDMPVGELLAPAAGLHPLLAGASVLGKKIAESAATGWSANAIWIQGMGHGNPGLQFRRPGWQGKWIAGNRWTPENLDVHLEVELVDGDPGPLKLHFETCPYYTRAEIAELDNPEDFENVRAAFRKRLKAHEHELDGWKLTRRPLQAAITDPECDAETSVGETVRRYAGAMGWIAAAVDDALAAARRG